MEILLASENHSVEITYIVNKCIEDMMDKGIYENTDNYPNINSINKDIKNKTLYILKAGKITVGAITLDEEQSPNYRNIIWDCKDKKVLVIHRLAVYPHWKEKGVAGKLLEFAEQYGIKNNYFSIRLDIGSNNLDMINIFKDRRYKIKGEINYSNDLPFYCFEKMLVNELTSISPN